MARKKRKPTVPHWAVQVNTAGSQMMLKRRVFAVIHTTVEKKEKEWIRLNQTTSTTHKLPNMLWGWENEMLTHSHMLKSHLNSSGGEGNTYQNPSMHLLERQTNMNQSVRLMWFGNALRCKRRQWSAGRDNRHSQEEWLLGKLLRPSETTSGSPVHSIFASTCPSGKQRWK